MELEEFVNQTEKEVEPLITACHLSWWNLATTGDKKYAEENKQSGIQLRQFYSSQKKYEYLLSQPSSEGLLKRQSFLLLNKFLENQIDLSLIQKIVELETEIENTYTNFRAYIDNKPHSNNEIKDILAFSTDSNIRQQAWEASKKIGEEVEQKVLNLIALRNESAQKVGFSNYYTMSLHLQELEEDHLFEILDQLEKVTTPLWEKYKAKLDQEISSRFNISVEEIRPWHYQDPFFQEAPKQEISFDEFYKGKDIVEISRRFYETIGLPVDDILNNSDLFERANKNQHAFCNCIDHKQDIRILCNIRDNEYWMSTQLHELGHAVYDKYIDQELPFFLRSPAHISTTEAIAMLFGRLSKHQDFLHLYCDIDENSAKKLGEQSKMQTAASLLVFARWVLVMVHFERAMYQKSTSDLNTLWWDSVEKFQHIRRIPKRHKPDWASKLHLACAPVYYQNYILGEMTASQLQHYIQGVLAEYNNEKFCQSQKVGELLKSRLFSLGAQFPWNQTLEKATNEPLNPQYFADDLSYINRPLA